MSSNKKQFNFYWVGGITTAKPLTPEQEQQARAVLKAKNCYPVFFTQEEIEPFTLFYESLLRLKMHNFLDLASRYEQLIE